MNIDTLLKNALIFDIETYAEDKFGNEIDIRRNFDIYLELAQCKWFGCYSFRDKKEYYLEVSKNREKIQKILDDHYILIGFNSEEFDYPILVNNGLINSSKKFNHIDCMKILGASSFKDKNGYKYKGRGTLMGYKFKKNSLQCMAETMNLDFQKSTIDYKIFKKDNYTEKEKKEIIKYLRNDVMATKGLFDKLYEYWLPFTQLLNWKDVQNFSWIKSSIASLIYKSACHSMNIDPTYSENPRKVEEMGGRVLDPKYEEVNDVWYMDAGCLNKGELVYTPNGYKNVENIKVYKNNHWCYNDKSLSQDNDFNNFVEKRQKVVKDLIKLELEDGSDVLQTLDHRILTNNGIKQTKNITINDKLISPVYTPIKEGEYNDFFELLGIFVCEGNLFRQKRFIKDKKHPLGRNSTVSQTHLSIKDHEINFKSQIESLLNKHVPYKLFFKLKYKINKNIKYSNQNIYDTRKEVYDWFDSFLNKYYNIKEISKDTGRVKAFLTGVLKSDACWNIKRNSVCLCTTDKYRIALIKRCFQMLGIHCNIVFDKKKHNKRNKTYILEVYYGSEVKKLFSWFKWNSYRDKKVTKPNNKKYNKKHSYLKIINIEKLHGKFEVYDLTMNRQESPYYVHNGIFTHNSLYPHIFCMFNLFAETSQKEGENIWHGNDIFKVKGYYDISHKHPLARTVEKKLKERQQLKKDNPDDPMIYTNKIFLNGLYGIVRSSLFEKVHTPNSGWDCCWIGQQIHEFVQKEMEKYGFEVIYGDTDSIFCKCVKPFHKKESFINSCLKKTVNKILKNVPFPIETFNIDIENYLEYILFPFSDQPIVDEKTGNNIKKGNRLVKEKKGRKKNYLYLYKDNNEKTKIQIMGLPIIKDNATPLGLKIYEEVLKPKILENKQAKFSEEFINYTIDKYLQKKEIMKLLAIEYKVKPFKSYKIPKGQDKPTGIHAQISKNYFNGGEGVIDLIKNKKIGKVGKGNKYCTIQDALKNKLTRKDLVLDKVYNELEPFIKYEN